MSESEIYDVVIIGGGPGGLTAGIYAMRAALKTVLVEMAAPFLVTDALRLAAC